jgi:hypothetical protein
MSDDSIIQGFKAEIVRETLEWRRPNVNLDSLVADFCKRIEGHRDRYLKKVAGNVLLEREIKDIADGATERTRRDGVKVYLPETAAS